MSTTAEPEVVSAMTAETPAATETQLQNPTKEKKPKIPKQKKKPREALSHPPYFQMIKEAILALQEKSGSSSYAIAKYMEEKHKGVLPANYKKTLALQLKNFTAKGKLIKIKASFKLSELGKKVEVVKKAKTSVVTSKRTTRSGKKSGSSGRVTRSTKKVGGGRRATKSGVAKAKQPKSIKSPAVKKAKK